MSETPQSHVPRYCCCGHPGCKKPVKKDGHRMSAFSGDHLRSVVKMLLPLPCHAPDRALVIENPSRYRVHTSHFREEDKVPSQGGGRKLKDTAIPIPVVQLFKATTPQHRCNMGAGAKNKENIAPVTNTSLHNHVQRGYGGAQTVAGRSPIAGLSPRPLSRPPPNSATAVIARRRMIPTPGSPAGVSSSPLTSFGIVNPRVASPGPAIDLSPHIGVLMGRKDNQL